MYAIVLVIIAAFAACIIFDKKPVETIPVAVFATTLGVYALALFLPLNISVYVITGLIAAVALAAVIFYPKFTVDQSHFVVHRVSEPAPLRDLLHRNVLSASLIVPVAVCVVFCALLYNRRAFFYDDLSYWALYTKNIFCIDRLPHLFENCSVDYKDYTPIIQILQYIALFGRRSFDEPVMFQTNVCLIYVLLLPLLRGIEDKNRPVSLRVAALVLYVIFPHVFTAQFYYRLGVDLLLALTFGYALIGIFLEEKKDLFRITALITSLSFLALIKTSGIVLCIFAIIMYVVHEMSLLGKFTAEKGEDKRGETEKKRNVAGSFISTAVIALFTFGSYFSWQLFLKYSWNNGYLSNRVKDGIKGRGFAFPAYTKEVVLNYIKHFFIYPLTRNRIGVTAAVLTMFIILVFVLTRKESGMEKKKEMRNSTVMFVSIMIFLFLFAIAHMCMYLFIFDEWEAHGLLEFDRYITQYLGGAVFLYMCLLIRRSGIIPEDLNAERPDKKESDSKEHVRINRRSRILLYVTLAVFIVLLPYPDMNDFLIPSHYAKMLEKEYAKMAANAQRQWDQSGIDDLGLTHDGTQKVTLMTDAWDETTQFIEYIAVPQPIYNIVNVPAIDAGNIAGFTESRLEQYVYVAENAPKSYAGDWNETAELTDDKEPLCGGVLYLVERDNDTKTLVKVK